MTNSQIDTTTPAGTHTNRTTPPPNAATSVLSTESFVTHDTKHRHIRAIGEAMVQRFATRGVDPNRHELLYWLREPDALHNADAIQRYVHRMLKDAPPMDLEDKGLFIESMLRQTLEAASS